ncbi:hypothetical protein HHI36_000175 [Cryptolaemus montrouzieri]|uniref:Uncharacterized protein n=1 Tax=Cryptolaemus montrouzieri TaxID=559131 RepID=A0ABD2P3U6_9CUCU
MFLLKCTVFLFLLFAACKALSDDSPLDQLQGSWMIRNSSKNALSMMGECPSVLVEPPLKNAHDKNGKIFYKSLDSEYKAILHVASQSTYQLFYPVFSIKFRVGNLTILNEEKDEFLIVEIKRYDDLYYLVLTNEVKDYPSLDNKVRQFWNSSTATKNVPLFPVKQENCEQSDDKEEVLIEKISTVIVEETLITGRMEENDRPNSTSNNPETEAPPRRSQIQTEIKVQSPTVTSAKIWTNYTTPSASSTTTPTAVKKGFKTGAGKNYTKSSKRNTSFRIVPNSVLLLTSLMIFISTMLYN